MAKYMILYQTTPEARQRAMGATPAEVEASMGRWIAWRDDTAKQVKVEFGLPLKPVASVTASGVGDSSTAVSGSSTLEGDKDVIIELIKTHPHLQTPGNSIELLELIPLESMTGE